MHRFLRAIHVLGCLHETSSPPWLGRLVVGILTFLTFLDNRLLVGCVFRCAEKDAESAVDDCKLIKFLPRPRPQRGADGCESRRCAKIASQHRIERTAFQIRPTLLLLPAVMKQGLVMRSL